MAPSSDPQPTVNTLPPGGFRLVTLGRIALVSSGAPADSSLEALSKRRLKLALLVVLALSKRPLPRDFLVGMFWGDQDEERARHSLSDALSHLRSVLGRDAITVRRAEAALSDQAPLVVDAVEFADAVAAGDHARAIALYGGPFLDSVYVAGSVEFEQWADRERARLAALFVRACEAQCMALARARRWDECALLAERWLDAAPLSADAALYRLNALKASGTRDADHRALEEYERLATLLGREYGRAPDRAVAALARDIAARLEAGDATGEFRAPDGAAALAPLKAEPREVEPSTVAPSNAAAARADGVRGGAGQPGTAPDANAPGPPLVAANPAPAAALLVERAEPAAPPTTEPDETRHDRSRRSGNADRAAVARSRWRWGLAAGLAAGVGLVTGAVLLTSNTRGPVLDPRRVAVVPFENASRDPSLDVVGRLAADYVAQGVAQVGSLALVGDPGRAAGAEAAGTASAAGGAGVLPRDAPEANARAATEIAGSYNAVGDSVELRAQLVDVRSGDVLATVGPLRAARADPRPALDELRQRAAGGLGVLTDSLLGRWALPAGPPPTYAAYQELMAGLTVYFGDRPATMGDAAADEIRTRLAHAAALDTAYLQPRIWLAWYHTVWFFRGAAADSILRPLESARDRLSPFEMAFVDVLRSMLNGDVIGGVAAWRGLTTASPLPYFKLRYVQALLIANRPHEALRVARSMAPGRGADAQLYWGIVAQTEHYLGDHRAELDAARTARTAAPQNLGALFDEVAALAALGDVDRLEAALRQAHAMPYDPRAGLDMGDFMTGAALELRAHGRPDDAARLLAGALAWFDERPTWRSLGYPVALYAAGRWEDARRAAQSQLAADSDNVFLNGISGRAAARLGDRATAERISGELAALTRPGLRGMHTLERAKIAAVLGDRAKALGLLRDATSQGLTWWARSRVHQEIDFEPLRGDPAFRQLVEPQG